LKLEMDIGNFLDELYSVYRAIDKVYAEIASRYDFSCKGCEDNCCNTVFYHYTLIEYFGVLEGFDKLTDAQKTEALRRAKDYVAELNKFRAKEAEMKRMCPLNFDGLCSIYEYRPLICRIHGVPGLLRHPIKGTKYFSGCRRFESLFKDQQVQRLDRTEFFTKIATLETRLRTEMDYMLKFQKTIAEMILNRDLLSYNPLGISGV